MPSTPVRLTAFAAVFTVGAVAPSLRFFVDRLGFKVDFQMGDPPSYAIIERDTVSLHLMPAAQEARGLGRSSIYVFVAGVDALHDELKARGCPIESAPKDYSYGMREMSVRDPDGNRVTFGQEVKKPAS
jgi:catechol 2,3-dioxygenase-like lactoylglutathione lyase family enzyme